MPEIKLKFAIDLHDSTLSLLNSIKKDDLTLEDACLYHLGATNQEISICLQKITTALPDSFFLSKPLLTHEIQEEIVKNFVLFLAQEDLGADQNFDQHFANFIYDTINEIGEKHHLLAP